MIGLLSFIVVVVFAPFVFAGSNAEGIQFLEENKKKEGVIELPSGLQYKVLKKGSGVYHPTVSTSCLCHYAGTLISGETFDSSYDRGEPTAFAPNQVIKGWTEAMQLMTEGDKWELYIPSDLAYGDSGSPPKIPPGAVLIFTMEIMKIQEEDVTKLVPALKCDPKDPSDSCNEEEMKYITKIEAWETTKKVKEFDRLTKIVNAGLSNVKPDLAAWMRRRLHILSQLVATAEKESEL